MNISFRSCSRRRGLLRVCAVSVTGMALVAAYAADDTKPDSQMIVTPIEDARFVPVDPQRPQGAQMAVLWGDPNTGPSATLLRMGKGVNAMHVGRLAETADNVR